MMILDELLRTGVQYAAAALVFYTAFRRVIRLRFGKAPFQFIAGYVLLVIGAAMLLTELAVSDELASWGTLFIISAIVLLMYQYSPLWKQQVLPPTVKQYDDPSMLRPLTRKVRLYLLLPVLFFVAFSLDQIDSYLDPRPVKILSATPQTEQVAQGEEMIVRVNFLRKYICDRATLFIVIQSKKHATNWRLPAVPGNAHHRYGFNTAILRAPTLGHTASSALYILDPGTYTVHIHSLHEGCPGIKSYTIPIPDTTFVVRNAFTGKDD